MRLRDTLACVPGVKKGKQNNVTFQVRACDEMFSKFLKNSISKVSTHAEYDSNKRLSHTNTSLLTAPND